MEEEVQISGNPFRATCIDDTDKPLQIDEDQWIIKNTEYIVTGIFKDLITNEMSFKLLDLAPEPCKGFRASRFVLNNAHSVN